MIGQYTAIIKIRQRYHEVTEQPTAQLNNGKNTQNLAVLIHCAQVLAGMAIVPLNKVQHLRQVPD